MPITPIVTAASGGDVLQFSPTERLNWKATLATTGAFRFKVADSIVVAEPGTFLFVPRGTAHTWTNATDVASTMLINFIPGGMEAFFKEAAPLMHAEPLDREGLTAVNARHATTVVGPPLPAGPLTDRKPS